jgi:hypothetical protein
MPAQRDLRGCAADLVADLRQDGVGEHGAAVRPSDGGATAIDIDDTRAATFRRPETLAPAEGNRGIMEIAWARQMQVRGLRLDRASPVPR